MTFLLLRSSDHLLLGIAWAGMSMSAGDPPSPAQLTAIGDDARITITLPPQHISEETSDATSPAPMQLPAGATTVPAWRAALAGSSRLVISIARGTVVPLTVEAILQALAERPVVTAMRSADAGTALELPSRLTLVTAHTTTVVCRHPSTPQFAADGTTGLWRTRLARSTPAADEHIEVLATGFDPNDPAYDLPLPSADRALIVDATSHSPALATRLELSALGGTLDVAGAWPNYQWEHHCVLGRDMKVRTLARGALFPFGHKAQLTQMTTRTFDPSAGNAAVLRTERALTIIQPVRTAAADPATQRGFPFPRVEITTTTFTDLAVPQWTSHTFGGTALPTYFWPERINSATGQREKVQMPVVCDNPDGPVSFAVPMIFVADHSDDGAQSLTDPGLTQELARAYGEAPVPVPGSTVNLVGADVHQSLGADPIVNSYELQGMSITGLGALPDPTAGYRAAIASMMVATPALRSLLGTDEPRLMRYAANYLNGTDADVLLHIDAAHTIDLNFTAAADRCGALVSPHYFTDAISRKTGPVNLSALPTVPGTTIDPKALFPADATILGFSMRDLIAELHQPPTIISDLVSGTAPAVTMKWDGVTLGSHDGFVADANATLDLTVKTAPGATSTHCGLHNFGLRFPPGEDAVLALRFAAITYDQNNGQPPRLDTSGVSAQFLNDLRLLEKLADAVDLRQAGRLIDIHDNAVTVHYTFAPPPISTGAFVMRNIAFTTAITVPFDARPVTVTLSFSSRANPFQLAVLMFGGTGYAELELDKTGLRRLEGVLEFGAIAAVDFVIARGEVHVLGGVRFTLEPNGSVTVTGYLRIGGSVDILGLVSVSIELIISLAYQSARNALVGRATIVVTIDLTLWSDTMEIDSGEWVLAGDQSHTRPLAAATAAFDGLAQWRSYRQAFFAPQRINAAAPDYSEQP